jgi:hypothetical protein
MHVGGGQTADAVAVVRASLAEVFVQRRSRETLVIFFTQAGKVATWWEGVVTFLHPQWLSLVSVALYSRLSTIRICDLALQFQFSPILLDNDEPY